MNRLQLYKLKFLFDKAAPCGGMLCFSAIPDKKFHKYLAVDKAETSAFFCSSRDKSSSNFSQASLW